MKTKLATVAVMSTPVATLTSFSTLHADVIVVQGNTNADVDYAISIASDGDTIFFPAGSY